MTAGKVVGIVLDIETTGLGAEDVILEVGMLAVDRDFDIVGTLQVVISSANTRYRMHEVRRLALDGDEAARYVVEMHTGNGLFAAIDAERGVSPAVAEERLLQFLEEHSASGLPMTGSSVHFDRRFLAAHMPKVEAMFHYRNIDISSIREWVATYRPGLFRDFVEPAREELPRRALHRAVADCKDTLDELRLYTEVLL